MFALTMPAAFAIGQTADVKINGDQTQVTWLDAETLRIGADDPRKILIKTESDDLTTFYCSDDN